MIEVCIPAVTDGRPDLLRARISYRDFGNGTFWLNNIEHVSDINRKSLINCKMAAQWLAGRTFTKDVTIKIEQQRHDVTGRSWELMLVLGLTSLLTGIPLNPRVTGSGLVGQDGIVLPITSLREKAQAAKDKGFRTFLVSREQSWEPVTSGIDIQPVADIRAAWIVVGEEVHNSSILSEVTLN